MKAIAKQRKIIKRDNPKKHRTALQWKYLHCKRVKQRSMEK